VTRRPRTQRKINGQHSRYGGKEGEREEGINGSKPALVAKKELKLHFSLPFLRPSPPQSCGRLGLVFDTDFLLNQTSPCFPLSLPPSSYLLRICVLRTEDNPVYGACILPAFHELFREAGREGGGEGGVVVELVDWLVKRGEHPPIETWGEYAGEEGGREGGREGGKEGRGRKHPLIPISLP